MSDLGDSFREMRDARWRDRLSWHECGGCGIYAADAVKVPPGGKCHMCGWEAPPPEKRPRRRLVDEPEYARPHRCECGKRFTSVQAQNDHARTKKHAPLPPKEWQGGRMFS